MRNKTTSVRRALALCGLVLIGAGALLWAGGGPASGVAVRIIAEAAADPAPAGLTAGAWWKGGTLHNVPLATWRAATDANRLATAADWLSNTTWKGRIRTWEDVARLRVAAARLALAVSAVADRPGTDGRTTAEVAAQVLAMLEGMNP